MTVLIDSSAWIDYLRGTGSAADHHVRELVASSEDATTDPVLLEVVAGGRSRAQVDQLNRLLGHAQYIPQAPRTDVLLAVDVYRRCRAAGETIRSLNDCLIAAIAIRADVPVLHNDRDYDAMGRHTDLQVTS